MNNFGKKVNPDDKDMDREMARERGIATYVSKIPCKHGHTGLRYTKSGERRACVHTRNYKARGTQLPHAKLTKEIVRTMRIRNSMGVSCKRMAKQYGVHVNTVERAVNLTNWWHR